MTTVIMRVWSCVVLLFYFFDHRQNNEMSEAKLIIRFLSIHFILMVQLEELDDVEQKKVPVHVATKHGPVL